MKQTIQDALSAAMWSWFDFTTYDEDPDLAKSRLKEAWLTSVQAGTEDEEFSVAFLHWGRSITQDEYAEWASGFAAQIAEDACTELIQTMDIFAEETQVDRLERDVRARYAAKLSEDTVMAPHRAVRRGPTQRRGGHKSVRPHVERYNDDDGWNEKWRGYKLEYGIKDQQMPFYKQVMARPIYLVLHLFSGRRRGQDFHWLLADMVRHAKFNIHVLSLDTAIDRVIGNLAWTGASWAKIMELLQSGRISSGLAGPPCETYSAARYNEPPSSHDEKGKRIRWPRPLRDEQNAWGIQGRTPRELQQLYVGSQLALQVMVVMIYLLISGGSFVNEHPAPPEEDWKASLYKTPLVALMKQFPEVALRIVNQGDYGASSTKPTGLLTLRMPHVVRALLRWRHSTPSSQREVAIGVDTQGRFKTAKLKEYPCHFAHGLAQAVYDSISYHHYKGSTRAALVDAESPLAKWVDEVLRVTTEIREADMQPDYQPGLG